MVGDYINTMKMTFDFNFDLNQAVKQHGHINIEVKKSYELKKKFSLITCKLIIRKSLLTNKTEIENCLHCIGIIAYHSSRDS